MFNHMNREGLSVFVGEPSTTNDFRIHTDTAESLLVAGSSCTLEIGKILPHTKAMWVKFYSPN